VAYQLQYVIGPKVAQKAKKPSSNKTSVENGTTSGAYAKAEKEFKLQWMK
jgi:hypothetical protein